jgi:small subunit ribosomal protein S16
MLIIRLFRTGKKKQPTYKIVVTDKKKPPSKGRFVDEVGFYNPITKERRIDKEKVDHWISKGAQKSETVTNILIAENIIEGKKIPKHKASKKKEAVEEKKVEKAPVKEEKAVEEPEVKEEPVEEPETKEETPLEEEKKE